MTAEIAILNKSAVVLAADSAVTISAGTEQHKVFDSEDKLFELSCDDPIGVMINANMQFMGAPLPVLVKRYRETCGGFATVEKAADSFIAHLCAFGAASPAAVAQNALYATLEPVWRVLRKRVDDKFNERLAAPIPPDTTDFANFFTQLRAKILDDQLGAMLRAFEALPETVLIGEAQPDANDEITATVELLNGEHLEDLGLPMPQAVRQLADIILQRRVVWSPHTGMIVAGFGRDELFPTLVSYEIYGMVGGRLRIFQTNNVDIDREGERSRIIPFAQKDMVDRFLFGLDEDIQRRVTDFCRQSIPTIRERMMEVLTMSDEDRADLERDLIDAEQAFLDSLRKETFDVIRGSSEEEMNGMIELMPKPEMARMAEALVNLTSIKRRVTRGMETVGGPIDVAVISRSEGFVWVKRKHYFAHELNSRYFERMRHRHTQTQEG